MYLRISISFLDHSLKTVDLNIDHIVFSLEDGLLSIYDHDLQIYDLDITFVYYFAIIDKNDAGTNYKCYNNLDLAFADIGLKEVEKYYL